MTITSKIPYKVKPTDKRWTNSDLHRGRVVLKPGDKIVLVKTEYAQELEGVIQTIASEKEVRDRCPGLHYKWKENPKGTFLASRREEKEYLWMIDYDWVFVKIALKRKIGVFR